MSIRSTFIIVLLVTLSSGHSIAQEPQRVATLLNIVMFEGTHPEEQIYYRTSQSSGASLQPIDVTVGSLGAPVKYSGPQRLMLGSRQGDEVSGGRTEFQLLAECMLPTRAGRTIVLLSPKEEGGYSAFAIDASLEKVPLGSTLVINASPYHILLKHGYTENREWMKQYPIRAKSSEVVTPINKEDRPLTGHRIHGEFYNDGDTKGDGKRFLSTRWYYTPDRRNYVIFYDRNKNGRPSMGIISGVPIE